MKLFKLPKKKLGSGLKLKKVDPKDLAFNEKSDEITQQNVEYDPNMFQPNTPKKEKPTPEPTPQKYPPRFHEKSKRFHEQEPVHDLTPEPQQPEITPPSPPQVVAKPPEPQPVPEPLSLVDQYNILQNEYNQYPNDETKRRLADLYLKLYPPTQPQPETKPTEQLTPEQIAEEYHTPQTEIIESTKHNPECVDCGTYIQYDENNNQFCPRCSVPEPVEETPEQVATDFHNSLADEGATESELFIESQRAKQGSVQKSRFMWRSELHEMEEFALSEFVEFQSHLTDMTDLVEKIQVQTVQDESFIDMDGEESLSQPDPIVSTPVVEPPTEHHDPNLLTNDLTMPTGLDHSTQKVWHLFPRDVQQQMIDNINEELKEVVIEKKKSIFGKKQNFFQKKKDIKKRLNIDREPTLFEKIFKIKKEQTLKDIEAYCYKCKHDVIGHQHKGTSTGCNECGCLVSVQEIIKISNVKFNTEDEVIKKDTGHSCTCGHREIIHQDRGFCEEKDCYCYEFKTAT